MPKAIKKAAPLPATPKAKKPKVSLVRQNPPTSSSAIPEDPIKHENDDASMTIRPKQLRPRRKKQTSTSSLPEVKIEEE